MKHVYCLLILFMLIASCRKEEFDIQVFYPGTMKYGKASAKKGYKTWVASAAAFRHSDKPIAVTSIDTIGNRAKGKFSVAFNIATTRGKINIDNPDQIRFSSGSFDVQIVQ